jgi:hypothetical protein
MWIACQFFPGDSVRLFGFGFCRGRKKRGTIPSGCYGRAAIQVLNLKNSREADQKITLFRIFIGNTNAHFYDSVSGRFSSHGMEIPIF